MDPLSPILSTLDAIRKALDLGGALTQAVQSGVGPLTGLFARYLVTTVSPSGGAFTLTSPVAQITPVVQGLAAAALALVVAYLCLRLVMMPAPRATLRTGPAVARLAFAALLIEFAPIMIQACIDASNTVSEVAWRSILEPSWAQILPRLAYDSRAPYLSALVVLAAFAAFITLAAVVVVRYALLGVLVSLSPIAALLALLPETMWLARLWSALFAAVLVSQPLQVLILGVGFGFDRAFKPPVGHVYALASLWVAVKVPAELARRARRLG